MTTTDAPSKFRYEGNGVTDTFAFTGRIFAAEDLVVEIILRSTDALVETLILTTHYTVTINGPSSASVQITAPSKIPSALQDIQIRRSLDKTQSLVLPTGTVFPAVKVETALDKVTAIVQEMQEELDRKVGFPVTSSDAETDVLVFIDDALIAAEAAQEAAEEAQAEAEQSAIEAAASAASLVGTSATSVLIGTGSKSFTTQTGKTFVGQNIIVASAADTQNYMHGNVTSYDTLTGALVLNSTNVGGTGTFSDWIISVSGTRGPTGATGATGPAGSGSGDMLRSNNLSDVLDVSTSRTNLGLGTIATQNSNGVSITGGTVAGITDLAVADGGTGASTAADARTNLGTNDASNLTAGTVATARLGSGTADSTTFLRGDNTWTAATTPTAFGAIGTYVLAEQIIGTTTNSGSTVSGANLRIVSCTTAGGFSSATSTIGFGTWRNMGYDAIPTTRGISLWLRVS